MMRYRKRIADDILKRKLEGKGAVVIEGPKWCGKTTTAEQIAASILYMDDPEKKEQNITMSELSPKRLLKGATPRLIDEWQLAPKLWDAIRFEVDHRGELGQFILTGSAVPADTREITHSGTGPVVVQAAAIYTAIAQEFRAERSAIPMHRTFDLWFWR